MEEIKGTFVALPRDTSEDPETALAQRVPDREYRATFLKLTRALDSTGKDFSVMMVRRSTTDPDPITLNSGSRKTIGELIRRDFTKPREQAEKEGSLTGKLRARHLDQDWLEVTVEREHIRVYGVGETVDDVIGPLMNREVVVHIATQPNGRIVFRDIEDAP